MSNRFYKVHSLFSKFNYIPAGRIRSLPSAWRVTWQEMLTTHGRPCDVRAERLDRAGERGHGAAEALRADAGGVYLVEDALLHVGVQRICVMLAHGAQQRSLGEIGRLVARAAEADADHDRRTGVGACADAGVRDKVDDLLLALPPG